MKKVHFYLFSLIFFSFDKQSFAHSHVNCADPKGNSCWFAKNESSNPVSIFCSDPHRAEFKTNLAPTDLYSYQFCNGYADGLGYPEPGMPTDCQVQYANGKIISFRFYSIDWGNRVDLTVKEAEIALKLSSVWNTGTVNYAFK